MLAHSAPPGGYADAFAVTVVGPVSLEAFLAAFYTTPVFRAERAVLALAGFSSSKTQLDALVAGRGTRFAAWTVVQRRPDEILLRDITGATASWFQVTADQTETTLRFGSIIYPVTRRGGPRLSPAIRPLLGPHRFYSRVLLSAAALRLKPPIRPR